MPAKYPVKTSLELTTEQDAFVEKVAAHLTATRGKRRVSKKSVWRLMNEHCQTCTLFLSSISMHENGSIDK